jgi:hypothetical protein
MAELKWLMGLWLIIGPFKFMHQDIRTWMESSGYWNMDEE